MRKLVVIATMVLLAGCVGMGASLTGVHRLDRATVNGQDIYVGMSQQKFETLMPAPDSSRNNASLDLHSGSAKGYGQNLVYGEYTIGIMNGAVAAIMYKKK